MSEYESVREEQRRAQTDVELNILKHARLVGMTTAGVASKQDLVAAMGPKVCLSCQLAQACIPMLQGMPALVKNLLLRQCWAATHLVSSMRTLLQKLPRYRLVSPLSRHCAWWISLGAASGYSLP